MGFRSREEAKQYTPIDDDTLEQIAQRETDAGNPLTWQDITRFNWGTDDPEVVDEFMRDQMGCYKRGEDKRFVFSADIVSREPLLIPVSFKSTGHPVDSVLTLRVRKQPPPPDQFKACCRVAGPTFEFDKSFVRPSVVDDLEAVQGELANHPDAKILVMGHTDKVGRRSYNKALSERRARSIRAFITNDVDTWVQLADDRREQWGLREAQMILKDMSEEEPRYDPGNVDGVNTAQTQAAVREFQTDNPPLGVDGQYGPNTRRVLYEKYMTGKHDIEIEADRFMNPPQDGTMGCGERNPLERINDERDAAGREADEADTEERCEENRRVTFFLFDEDRLPRLPCGIGDTGPCQARITPPARLHNPTFSCSFYDSLAKHCGCEGGSPLAMADTLHVHLKLVWTDPDGNQHPFPQDVPVRVTFGDGSTARELTTVADGMLEFATSKDKGSFSLVIEPAGTHYIATNPAAAGTTEAERYVPEADMAALVRDGWYMWRIPGTLNLDNCEWNVDAAAAPTYTRPDFTNLETLDAVGDHDTPCIVELDPRWSYMKLLYFDKKLATKLSIPPIVAEGFNDRDSTGGAPDSQSNWSTQSSGCQCLPWVLSKAADGSAIDKPDDRTFLRFRTKPDTFINSSAATASGGGRTLVTRNAGTAGTDPGLNEGTNTGDDIRTLDWDPRISYYDLPEVWASRNYWAQDNITGGAGARFEAVMTSRGATRTSDADPLLFSLDDVVLVDGSGRQSIQDKSSADADQALSEANSRLVLLHLDRNDDFNIKIHNPRADMAHYSNIPFGENLIRHTPEHARLVIFCSLFYSIWDKRTRQDGNLDFSANHVLGARAAVLNDATVHAFDLCRVNLSTNQPSNDYCQFKCGNYELHYLHYCGLKDTKPLSYLIIYWNCRFTLHSDTPATDPSLNANWRQNFEQNGMVRAMTRSTRPYLLTKNTGAKDILIRPYYYLEAKPDAAGGAHKCIVRVSKNSGAKMGPTEAKFEQTAHSPVPGAYGLADDALPDVDGTTYTPLTSSHEFGHATGCFDDYLYSLKVDGDRWSGIPTFSQPFTAPGGPYHRDRLARMYHNRSPRMRNYWHFVNWVNDERSGRLNTFLSGTSFKLNYTFAGPASPIEMDLSDARFRDTCSPSWRGNNRTLGTTGRADFLLYKTGGETSHALDTNHVFEGIMVIFTRINIDFDRTFWDVVLGRQWTYQDRATWIRDTLKNPIDHHLNSYYIECTGAAEFNKIYLLVNPFFWVHEAGSPPHTPHFEIEVTRNGGSDFSASGNEIECDNQVSSNRLVRYIYGKTSAMPFTTADLGAAASWVAGVAGGTAQVRSR